MIASIYNVFSYLSEGQKNEVSARNDELARETTVLISNDEDCSESLMQISLDGYVISDISALEVKETERKIS